MLKQPMALIGLIISLSALSANAALVSRLGGLAYYDTEADLTWLADANYAQTSNYSEANSVGRMNWADANVWAAGLTVDGVGGWRLPDTLQPDTNCSIQSGLISSGYNCIGSEMGNLFYNVLGGVQGQTIVTTHNANFDLFSNVQPGSYWSATEFAYATTSAWRFIFNSGNQGNYQKTVNFSAWAVQSGDVSAVPVPAAAWLFGTALLGLVGIKSKR